MWGQSQGPTTGVLAQGWLLPGDGPVCLADTAKSWESQEWGQWAS